MNLLQSSPLHLLFLATLLTLSACGGGGSETSDGGATDIPLPETPLTPPPEDPDEPVENRQPVASANALSITPLGNSVTLDGTGSTDPDGDVLSYSWIIVQAPFGSSATITDAGKAEGNLVPDVAGEYTLRLIATDGALEDRATVSITAGRVISGILQSDVTVTTAEGLALIDGNVQVADSATLTVEPGVRLQPVDGAASIELFGAMSLNGLKENQIQVQSITIALRDKTTSSFDATSVAFTDVVVGPIFFGSGFGSSGPIRIANSSMTGGKIESIEEGFIRKSQLIDIQPLRISGNPSIESNIFSTSSRPLIKFSSGVGATVNDNTFDVQPGELVIDYDPFSCDDSNFLVGPLNAENNFWQTTSSSVINDMILDANDDLGRCDPVSFEPFLTSPSPDTPM